MNTSGYRLNVNPREPGAFDKYVGQRLRERRKALGCTAPDLGKLCGITAQQIQKYEKGENKLYAGRLYQLSHILGVDFSYFFDSFDGEKSEVCTNTHPASSKPHHKGRGIEHAYNRKHATYNRKCGKRQEAKKESHNYFGVVEWENKQ